MIENQNLDSFETWQIPKLKETLPMLDVESSSEAVRLLREELTPDVMNSFPLWFMGIREDEMGGSYALEDGSAGAETLRTLRDGLLAVRGKEPTDIDANAQQRLFQGAAETVKTAAAAGMIDDSTADFAEAAEELNRAEEAKWESLRDVLSYLYETGVPAATIRALLD